MRGAIAEILPYVRPETGLVSFSKGIEESEHKFMHELFHDLAPNNPFAALGGPMLADEISKGWWSCGVIASKNETLRSNLVRLFSSDIFKAEASDDAFSVTLGGVLKNVYAVALGLAHGLELPQNQKGWLTAASIGEMIKIAVFLKADSKIILGTAGLGDFVTTGYSTHSRNRTVGEEIARLGVCNLRAEGLASLPSLIVRLGKAAEELPLLQLVRHVGIDCKPAAPAVAAFFDSAKQI
jgi:glycerol-3-phosphate dehydrogenase (NAD(P)+)